MAESSDIPDPVESDEIPDVAVGSEELFDVYCDPCSKIKKDAQAVKYCISCRENLCEKCVADHDKFQILRGHIMTEQADLEASLSASFREEESVVTESCEEHPGTSLTLFCEAHDMIVCSVCVSLHHRSCSKIEYIPTKAKAIRESREFCDVLVAAKTTYEICDVLEKEEQGYTDVIATKKQKAINDVREIKTRLVKRICELEEITIDEVNKSFEYHCTARTENMKLLTDIGETLKSGLEKLESESSPVDEANSFILMKKLDAHEKSGSRYLQNIRKDGLRKLIRFNKNTSLTNHVDNQRSLGVMEISSIVSAFPIMNLTFSVRFEEDQQKSDINGACIIDDGTFVITDYTNCCLKRFDGNFRKLERLALEGHPFGICRISSNEIATTLAKERQVLFARVYPSMAITKVIATTQMSRGLACYNNELYLCGGGGRVLIDGPASISVYKKNGKLLKTFMKDSKGQPIFLSPRDIIASDTGKFFITDSEKELIEMDSKGNVRRLSSFKAYAMAIKSPDELVITGKHSNNIVLINVASNEARDLVPSGTFERKAQAMIYVKEKSALVRFQHNDQAHVCALY